jgi:DNA end-binding protein Ku
MRPVWNGHIRFGLISIPVSIYSAVESSEHVSFRLVHCKDHAPIQYKKFCTKEDVEVPNDEIVKAYEIDEGEFATVEREELDELDEDSGKKRPRRHGSARNGARARPAAPAGAPSG